MKNNTFKTGIPFFWFPPKLLLIMKLIIVIMTTFLIQASASSFAQRITLNEKATSLQKILSKIRMQTGYDFISNNDLIKNSGPYSIQVNNVSLEEALNILFVNQDLTFLIEDKTVVIKQKAPSFLDKVSNILKIQEPIKGKIVDENRQPVMGATITEKGTNNRRLTDQNGEFVLHTVGQGATLLISYVGYVPVEYKVTTENRANVFVVLTVSSKKLDEVNVVSTGYQTIPKERATGSFEKINNELFNRNVTTDVLTRLEGITTGTLFSKRTNAANSALGLTTNKYPTIRGVASFLSYQPLIVVDNFPYDGDVNNINPNDVESVTLLKDAAAASIWGSQSGNGVVVITTKKGKFNQPLKVALNTNLTIAQKPDLFYFPMIKSSDFIDIEQFLYNKGVYDNGLNQIFGNFSPVIYILDKKKKGLISEIEANNQINQLRATDTRTDYMKYLYRESINQQYALNLSGGNQQVNFYLSGGFDKNLNSLVTSSNDRASFRSNVNYKPLKNLEIQTGILYTETNIKNIGSQFPITYGDLNRQRPYIRLKDEMGNALELDPVFINRNYRDTVGKGKLLDWHFRPLNELNESSNTTKSRDILLNLGATYKINSVLNASLKYQYERTSGQNIDWEGLNSFYTRNQINTFSDWRPATVLRAIPMGDIIRTTNSNLSAYSARAQVDAKKNWGGIHELNVISGVEIRQNRNWSQLNGVYGFNSNTLSTQPIDYVNTQVTLAGAGDRTRIPRTDLFKDQLNRFTSIFANATYVYKSRYSISASARKDATNFFGVRTNQKGTPLWSTGIGWEISREPFYDSGYLTYLKFRATYGYNGNAINTQSPKAIITYSNTPNGITLQSYAFVANPPNPELKWENVRIINLGIDFATRGSRFSGSIEYYNKHSTDVLSTAPVDQGSGFLFMQKNTANLIGKGVDVTLNSFNFQNTFFSWVSNLLFSYNKVVVSRYMLDPNFSNLVYNPGDGAINPVEGGLAQSLYTYKWAGLDPLTGAPQGFLNGAVSKDYLTLTSPTSIDDLDYHGSAVPLYYGAIRNTFSYKDISLSFNILYKFKYKFKRPLLSYSQIFDSGVAAVGSDDYARRWQKPGDELITNVPAFSYPADFFADDFYQNSSVTIENAAHIRLQNVNLSYNINKPFFYFKTLRLYANANNLGILWKATKTDYDPDYKLTVPNPKSLTLGLSAGF